MLYEVNQRYNNESDMSCFQKCQRIGFNLGSSSACKRSRRPRRIAQPNSYFRNFQVNVCNAKFTTSVQGKLAYDCLMFYSSIPDYSRYAHATFLQLFSNCYFTYREEEIDFFYIYVSTYLVSLHQIGKKCML